MVLRPELRVSVDVCCHRHSIALGLSTGELLEELDIDHRPKLRDPLFFLVCFWRRSREDLERSIIQVRRS